jgi:acetylornithine/N-succinyldiaminopimelate aminotransferase
LLLHDESTGAVISREERYLLNNYARTPFHPRDAHGSTIIDADGIEYHDLLGGIAVNALGHQHPRVVAALDSFVREPLHWSNLYFHPAQGVLAEMLVQHSMLDRAFFCNSGTEANEAALKFARLAAPGRSKIVALEGSFHGRTFGALSVTGSAAYRAPFEPFGGSTTFIAANDCEALASAIDDETSAIILEPILGEGGVVPLTAEFLAAARHLADAHGATLIFDEVQCGLGRTGTMFAFQQHGTEPDILTLAKPLGGGLPLGAAVVNSRIAANVKPGHHGTTFGGNPLACRLGIAVLETIIEERLLERVSAIGSDLGEKLQRLAGSTRHVAAIRGAGLMWGIELDIPAAPVATALRERRFIVGTARENVIRLLPPYIIDTSVLDQFLCELEAVLVSLDANLRKSA